MNPISFLIAECINHELEAIKESKCEQKYTFDDNNISVHNSI